MSRVCKLAARQVLVKMIETVVRPDHGFEIIDTGAEFDQLATALGSLREFYGEESPPGYIVDRVDKRLFAALTNTSLDQSRTEVFEDEVFGDKEEKETIVRALEMVASGAIQPSRYREAASLLIGQTVCPPKVVAPNPVSEKLLPKQPRPVPSLPPMEITFCLATPRVRSLKLMSFEQVATARYLVGRHASENHRLLQPTSTTSGQPTLIEALDSYPVEFHDKEARVIYNAFLSGANRHTRKAATQTVYDVSAAYMLAHAAKQSEGVSQKDESVATRLVG